MKEEIGIIGYEDDIIGFGLAGVKHIAEINREAKDEEITKALEHLRDVSILLVNESLHKKVKNHSLARGKFFVSIPEKIVGDSNKEIDNLVLETLRIVMRNDNEEKQRYN